MLASTSVVWAFNLLRDVYNGETLVILLRENMLLNFPITADAEADSDAETG